jgi:hypothetical protein
MDVLPQTPVVDREIFNERGTPFFSGFHLTWSVLWLLPVKYSCVQGCIQEFFTENNHNTLL